VVVGMVGPEFNKFLHGSIEKIKGKIKVRERGKKDRRW
jgi:hypothetical protein